MGLSVSVSSKAPENWNDFLLANPFGTVFQTAECADYYERRVCFQPLFFRANRGSETVGQLLAFKSSKAQVFLHNALRGHSAGAARLFVAAAKVFFPNVHWISGPVCSDAEAGRALVAEAVRFGRVSYALPHPLQGDAAFENSGLKRREKATFVIDLSLGKERLWQNVDNAARKNVRKTREDGVRVRSISSKEDYREYVRVQNESRGRSGASPHSFGDVYELSGILGATGFEVFVAELDGKMLAGLGVSFFNGYLNEWGAGTANYAIENKIYANDLVKWHVIETAVERGCKHFDLSGVSPNPANKKDEGIYRFKQKWGGELKKFSEFHS